MIILILQVLLVVLISVVTILYLFFWHSYGYWKKRGVNYEEPTFLFGSLTFLLKESISDALYAISKKHKRDYLGIYLSWKPTLLIQSKELAKQVLMVDSDCFQDRYSYGGLEDDPLGSLNLFSVKSPVWNQIRAEITPMFTRMRLKRLTELMNLNSIELVKKIQRDHIDNKQSMDIKNLFLMYTSDTVAYSVFGIRVSALKENDSPPWFITRPMAEWTWWRGIEFSMILLVPYIAQVMKLKFFSEKATNYIRQLFWNVVEERKVTGKSIDRDLVNHLLKIKENIKIPYDASTQYADDLILAQAAFFIFAAIETSSTTICYCLHELAHNPDKQEKLFEEVHEALQASGKEMLEFEELSNLKYLSACIQETLRKHTPVPFLDRLCNKTCKLNDELTVEAGTPVFVNVVAIHNNEEYYPEPSKWLPERFLDSTVGDNRGFSFLPFGEGPRNCIGLRYGLIQVRSAMAHMVAKYKFESEEPYILEAEPYSILLTPKKGYSVKFIPR